MRDQLRAAHLALTFLTTLPLPHIREVRDGDFAQASAYYPLAGYAVGGAVAGLLWLPVPLPGGVIAALSVGAWLLLTGMLHFDGLVDSADALFAMKTPAERLVILRDVHVGAFGLATGACPCCCSGVFCPRRFRRWRRWWRRWRRGRCC